MEVWEEMSEMLMKYELSSPVFNLSAAGTTTREAGEIISEWSAHYVFYLEQLCRMADRNLFTAALTDSDHPVLPVPDRIVPLENFAVNLRRKALLTRVLSNG